MSIFPKRSVPGSTVTIHWNFNTSSLKDVHVFPWVRIGVKDPEGKISMLFEKHVLALPDPQQEESGPDGRQLKYLHKSVPLLLLADCLSGHHTREKLVDILQNIQSGRHYYFTYTVPDNAPPGKYTLVSEVHSSGEIKYSNTAPDDFFLVEKVSLNKITSENGQRKAHIFNHSPEKVPVKIVSCEYLDAGRIKTAVKVFEMEALAETAVPMSSEISFLLYNEEREVIPLSNSSAWLLRNQDILQVEKNESNYLFKRDKEEAYKLENEMKTLWEKADGLLAIDRLSVQEKQLYNEMRSEELIREIIFDKV